MIVFAGFVARGRLGLIFVQAVAATKVNAVFLWEWKRSWLIVVGAFGFWLIPLVFGALIAELNFKQFDAMIVFKMLLLNILVVGLAEELFFREALLRAFAPNPSIEKTIGIFLFSSICFYLFHIEQGDPSAIIATGAGAVYMALRMAGVNILLVALLHGLSNTAFKYVVTVSFPSHAIINYYLAIYALATALLAWALLATSKKIYKQG